MPIHVLPIPAYDVSLAAKQIESKLDFKKLPSQILQSKRRDNEFLDNLVDTEFIDSNLRHLDSFGPPSSSNDAFFGSRVEIGYELRGKNSNNLTMGDELMLD
jgi:hypothetical protein